MSRWTDQDLLRLDAEFAQEGVAMHARPMRAAMSILGSGFVIGVLGNPEVDRITEAYLRLFPQTHQAWPGKGIGLAASVDTVRKVTVAVIFGTCAISVHKGLGFETHEDWVQWCRGDPAIAACSALAFADTYDLAYGVNPPAGAASAELWRMALSNLEDVANILPTGFSVDSVLQPICLTAELSMKAALVDLGDDSKALARRDVGHNHEELARRLAARHPHRDDPIVAAVATALPDYVDSRYKSAGLTRLAVVKLALGAQFIAASAARRLGDQDFADEMEQESWPGPRKAAFYA
ncbi:MULTISPECIES: hypothetical protein [Sphingobium]|uniref:hypothetical protein n=1 Tax=Sphingobium TaxID=165695 RepID=UPI00214BD3EB|nr:hypothetical protein [Sphingobium sp. CFD-2]MDF0545447.1 hypothetical protein [Sphingobium arseniciresistens]